MQRIVSHVFVQHENLHGILRCVSTYVRPNVCEDIHAAFFGEIISAHRDDVAVKHARLAEGHQHVCHRVPARKEVVVDLRAPDRRRMSHRERLWMLVFSLLCSKHNVRCKNMRFTTVVCSEVQNQPILQDNTYL